MLQKQKDKFWKIDSSLTQNNNNNNNNKNVPPPPSQPTNPKYAIKPKRLQPSSRTKSSNNIGFSTDANAFDFNNNNPNPSQPPFQPGMNNNSGPNNNNNGYSRFNRSQLPSTVEENQETNSDPGAYDGYQQNAFDSMPNTPNSQYHGGNKPSFNQMPQKPQTPNPHKTEKLKSGKANKKHKRSKKPPAKHKRGAQSNKFFNRDSKYLKKRDKNDKKKKKNMLQDRVASANRLGNIDTTINGSGNGQIQHSHSLRADDGASKRSKHGIQRSVSANELPSPYDNNNNQSTGHHRHRLSIMDSVLPTDLNEYKVEEEFYNKDGGGNDINIDNEYIPPFGKVAIVSTDSSDSAPYLLQVSNKSDPNYHVALDVMDRLGNLINPYIITQLQRGETYSASWSSYNCPSNGCLTNCLHLFRNVSVTSVRILIAEVICGIEYLHNNNFNFPNLSPETIYISHKSHIILTDFGFALPNNSADLIYRSGPLCYAPPEFLLNGIDDLKSDWWRLGILIYHLIVGKPPFMGDREQVCQQICQSMMDKDELFSRQKINDVEVDEDTKDLIIKLLKRERKERLGCLSRPKRNDKDKRSKKSNNTKYGVEAIMNHPFFECIWNKKNKDYQYTWNDIRKRQHKPAPILRHLATRATDSPRERLLDNDLDHPMHSFNDWKDDYDHQSEQKRDDDAGSIVDTTDDEEYQTDEDEEKSLRENSRNNFSVSKSNKDVAPVLPPINDEIPGSQDYINNTNLQSMPSGSAGIGISPLNSASPGFPGSLSQSNSMSNQPSFMFPGNTTTTSNNPSLSNNNNGGGLSPLPQSPPVMRHKLSTASAAPPTQHLDYAPPPNQSPQFMSRQPQPGSLPNSGGGAVPPPIGTSINNMPPGVPGQGQGQGQQAQFPVGPRSAPVSNSGSRPITPIASQFNIRPKGARHRKQASSKIDFVPTRALPPAPPNKGLPSMSGGPPQQQRQQQNQQQRSHYGQGGPGQGGGSPSGQYGHNQQQQNQWQQGLANHPPKLAQSSSNPPDDNYSPGQDFGSNGMFLIKCV